MMDVLCRGQKFSSRRKPLIGKMEAKGRRFFERALQLIEQSPPVFRRAKHNYVIVMRTWLAHMNCRRNGGVIRSIPAGVDLQALAESREVTPPIRAP